MRLTIEQFGNNRAECVLQSNLLQKTETYDVVLESLYISSDIPIFPAGTEVFRIVYTALEQPGQVPDLTNHHGICVVGPVYNWIDFAYQIQAFLDHIPLVGECNIEGALLTQKTIAFRATDRFWEDHYLHFTPQFAEIFELGEFPVMYARYAAGTLYTSNIPADVSMFSSVHGGVAGFFYSTVVTYAFGGALGGASIQTKSRMDTFENRHKLRIDSVLPLPHEIFAVAAKGNSAEISNRYTFMEFDFPPENLSTKLTVFNNFLSDNRDISQKLLTGSFQLVKPSPHSGLKKMLAGQTQDQRFEFFLIRKTIMADGTLELVSEPYPMSDGDYFRMVLLFSQEV